ncbi:MAG TPA: metallophosphoesterase [Terriglobales bacterium]|nr:metallophosphoesterase [Terriglobales bacterium]
MSVLRIGRPQALFNHKRLSRRQFLYAGALAGGAAALGIDGLVRSNHPRVVKIDIPLARLPRSFDGFTIAQLSDFHYEEHFSVVPIRKAVELANQLAPDLIVLTGDFITVPLLWHRRYASRAAQQAAPCAAILQELKSRAGSFAIMGNHDAMSDPYRITRALEDRGISVLRNRSVPLERGADRIWLAGIDDLLRGRPDLGPALGRIPPTEAVILLAHEPDFADEVSLAGVDLQLSGHSHGGQIWIPGIGAPWLPTMARRYPRGLYKVRNLTLYTNIGIGTIRAPIRINCPPEVTLITLRASQG